VSVGDTLATEQPSHRPGPPAPPYGFQPQPGYGPAPGFGAPVWYGPPPPVPPPGPIRPRLVWVVLTWVLCAIVTASSLTWGFLGLQPGISNALPIRTFASGENVVIGLDPAEAPAIYAGFDEPGSGSGFNVSQRFSSPVDARCSIYGDGQDVSVVRPERTVRLTDDGVEWHQILLIHAPRPYDMYVVRCEGEGARFGVGRDLPDGFLTPVFGALAVTFAAVVIAAVVTIVVLVKRAAARRLLPPPVWWSPTIP
jgi:hypothetical protein